MANDTNVAVESLRIPMELQHEQLRLSEEIDTLAQQYEAVCEQRLSLKHQIEERHDRINDILREVRCAPLLHQGDGDDDGEEA